MPDVLLINPAAYPGTARRGPYELTTFVSQFVAAGITAELLDVQEEVGAARIPYPQGHLAAVIERIRQHLARLYIVNIRTTGGPLAHEISRAIRKLGGTAPIVAYAPRIEERIRRLMLHDDAFDALLLSDPEIDVVSIVQSLIGRRLMGPRMESADVLRGFVSLDDVRRGYVPRSTTRRGDSGPGEYLAGSPWLSDDRTIGAVHVGRGCPDRCTFCAAPLGVGAVPRYATAAGIVSACQPVFDTLDPERRLFVMLETENLTSNRSLIREIAEERTRRQCDFLWGAYGRIDHMDPEFQQLLVAAGCRFLFFGIETASFRLLKILGKQFDPAIVVPRLTSLHRAGITTQSSLMFGIPTETYEEFLGTVGLAAEIAWAGGFIDLTPMRIEAGSPMERMTAGHPLRIMRSSELFQDLTGAGVQPGLCDSALAYRMYALDLPDFDIDAACHASRRMRTALVHWPLTTYVIHRGLNIPVRVLVDSAQAASQPIQGKNDGEWLRELLDAQASPGTDFALAMYHVEEGLAKGVVSGASPNYMIEPMYRWLRSHPSEIPKIFGLGWWSRKEASLPALSQDRMEAAVVQGAVKGAVQGAVQEAVQEER